MCGRADSYLVLKVVSAALEVIKRNALQGGIQIVQTHTHAHPKPIQ